MKWMLNLPTRRKLLLAFALVVACGAVVTAAAGDRNKEGRGS